MIVQLHKVVTPSGLAPCFVVSTHHLGWHWPGMRWIVHFIRSY